MKLYNSNTSLTRRIDNTSWEQRGTWGSYTGIGCQTHPTKLQYPSYNTGRELGVLVLSNKPKPIQVHCWVLPSVAVVSSCWALSHLDLSLLRFQMQNIFFFFFLFFFPANSQNNFWDENRTSVQLVFGNANKSHTRWVMSFTLTPDGHVTRSSLQHIGCSFFSCCNSLAKVFFLQVPQEGKKLFLCRSLFCGWLCCNALAFRHGNTVLLKIPESESTALHRKIWDCFCVLSRSSFVCNEWPSRTGGK